MKTKKAVIEYLNWCQDEGAIPRFRGCFPFEVLRDCGMFLPFYTSIRVVYTGSIDTFYYVNDANCLIPRDSDGDVLADYHTVLSGEQAPYGWEPEKLKRQP